MDINQNMYKHFSRVASDYRQVRTTDVEPVAFIGETLKGLPRVNAADVGCGAGRYDLLLFQFIQNLHLTCIDINETMLKEVSDHLRSHNITNFRTIKADADVIVPLEDDSMDCIFTFNAIHHFEFVEFIEKSSRATKENGWVFIYTRLRSQNARNIWGQYFPLFAEIETRLYELHEMEQWIKSLDSLRLEEAKPFKYKRLATLEELVKKVKARHYSTFSFYQGEKLDESLEKFKENVREQFQDTDKIEWFDENILLILKRY